MARRNDWQRRLFAAIEAHRRQPFTYGQSDCWTLANEAVRAMTGKPLVAGVRYNSAVGAQRALKNRGNADLADVMATSGLPEVAPVMAQRGDIGIIETADGSSVAVCVGAQWAHKNQAGLTHMPRQHVIKAYRVG